MASVHFPNSSHLASNWFEIAVAKKSVFNRRLAEKLTRTTTVKILMSPKCNRMPGAAIQATHLELPVSQLHNLFLNHPSVRLALVHSSQTIAAHYVSHHDAMLGYDFSSDQWFPHLFCLHSTKKCGKFCKFATPCLIRHLLSIIYLFNTTNYEAFFLITIGQNQLTPVWPYLSVAVTITNDDPPDGEGHFRASTNFGVPGILLTFCW